MSRRGFLLLASLLLGVLMLVLGGAYLYSHLSDLRSAQALANAQSARSLAESGIEEALLKVRHDPLFPPLQTEGGCISYQEEVADLGLYRVTVDAGWSGPPYRMMVIESEGILGTLSQPRARSRVRVVVDTQFTRIREWDDTGSLR